MSQARKSKAGVKKNTSTQTRDVDTILEIARLQEQVKLLTIENEHLRKYTVEKPKLTVTSKTPSPVNVPRTPKHPGLSNERTQENQSARKSKPPVRGCTCKGNCSSKICGCVKKNSQCGEWCKCTNDVCQNQEQKQAEQNKENLEENANAPEEKEIANKHLRNTAAQKSLFSPDITVHNENRDVENFKTRSLYFGSAKKLTLSSDEDEGKLETRSKSVEKNVTRRRGRPKKDAREQAEPERTEKIVSAEVKTSRSKRTVKRSPMKDTSDEVDGQADDEYRELEQRAKNYLRNITDGLMPLRRGQKLKEQRSAKEASKTNPTGESESNGEVSAAAANQDKNESFDLDEDNINPMKPKHELARTPTQGASGSSHRSTSEEHVPRPVISNDVQEKLPVPAEFEQAEVDWDEYQSQLVSCEKCKRKFHPYRIKKHLSCCKKL